jgi:hypothetical protein
MANPVADNLDLDNLEHPVAMANLVDLDQMAKQDPVVLDQMARLVLTAKADLEVKAELDQTVAADLEVKAELDQMPRLVLTAKAELDQMAADLEVKAELDQMVEHLRERSKTS